MDRSHNGRGAGRRVAAMVAPVVIAGMLGTVLVASAAGATAAPRVATMAPAVAPAVVPVVRSIPALDATGVTLKPIVAPNPTTNDLATKGLATIVMTGTNLPQAPRQDIGVANGAGAFNSPDFVQVKDDTAGWIAGVGTGGFFKQSCLIVVGASSPTEVVLAVGNIGVTCFKSIQAGDNITVTLFDGSGNAVPGASASGVAIAPGAVPEVKAVVPNYGPETGGNPGSTDNAVTVETAAGATPEAVWFGGWALGFGWYGVASTNITPRDATHFAVVPPAFEQGKQGIGNFGVSVFDADQAGGMSAQACDVLIAGCNDEYLYMHHSTIGPVELNASDMTLAEKTWSFGGDPSPACGLSDSGSNGGSLSISADVNGAASLTGDVSTSKSNLHIPEAIAGNLTLNVTSPIVFGVHLKGQISGCLQIPIPIPVLQPFKEIFGLYFVVGGQISANVDLSVTIAKGTYTFSGGWIPGTGMIPAKFDTNCVDANDHATKECVSTKLDAGVSGSLSVTPLWLQFGPKTSALSADLGIGLTAAGYLGASISIPPWPPQPQFSWDVCVSLHWAAELKIPALKFDKTLKDNLFLINLAGQGDKCPLGNAAAGQPAVAPGVAASKDKSTAAAAPGSLPADGSTTATVTVTIKDESGNPIVGDAVTLAQDNGKSSVIMTAADAPVNPAGVSTDATGTATFHVKDSVAEPVTYTATDVSQGNLVVTQTTDVTFASAGAPPAPAFAALAPLAPFVASEASSSTVAAAPGAAPADGTSEATITVTLKSASGQPIVGHHVTLAAGSGSSVISAPSGPSGPAGVVTFTVTDTTVEGPVRYTATDTDTATAITQTTSVNFVQPRVSPIDSTVTVDHDQLVADGVTQATVTVTLRDEGGTPMPGLAVSLTAGSGGSVVSAASGPSDSNGVVTFRVKDTHLESVEYTAKDTTDNITLDDQATVDFIAGPVSASASTMTIEPSSLPANGVTAAQIIVKLKDDFGHPVEDHTATLGQGSGHSTITQPDAILDEQGHVVDPATSDSNGELTFEATDTTPEGITLAATSGSVTIAQTVSVTFDPVTVSSDQSGTDATPGTSPADGTTCTTVTVWVYDAGGEPIAGQSVTLAADGGRSAVISAPSGVSDAQGLVTFTVTDHVEELVMLTAANATDHRPLGHSAFVQFTNTPPVSSTRSTVVSSPGWVPNDLLSHATITVTLVDDNGTPVPGKVVVLSQPTGKSSLISGDSGPTDANGKATFDVSDATKEAVTYTASDDLDGITVSQTADVNFGGTASLVPLVAARILETRAGSPTVDGQFAGVGALAAGAVLQLPVAGRGGVAADASAVVMNVTVTQAQGPGFITVYPCGSPRPNASNLNYGVGQTIPNSVTSKIGAGGKVCLFSFAATDVIVDVDGYYPA